MRVTGWGQVVGLRALYVNGPCFFWGGHVSPVFRSTGLVSGADTSYVGYVGGI